MNKKIGVVSLGCPKNLVDSEIMLGSLKKKVLKLQAIKKRQCHNSKYMWFY